MKQKNKINFNIFVVLIVPLLSPLQIPRIPANNFPYRTDFTHTDPAVKIALRKNLYLPMKGRNRFCYFHLTFKKFN